MKVERDETIDQAGLYRDLEDFPEIVGGVDVPTPVSPRAVVATGGDGNGAGETGGDEE